MSRDLVHRRDCTYAPCVLRPVAQLRVHSGVVQVKISLQEKQGTDSALPHNGPLLWGQLGHNKLFFFRVRRTSRAIWGHAIDLSEPATLLTLQILLGLNGDTGPNSKTLWGIQLNSKPNAPAVATVFQRAIDLLNAVIELVASKTSRHSQAGVLTPFGQTFGKASLPPPRATPRLLGTLSLRKSSSSLPKEFNEGRVRVKKVHVSSQVMCPGLTKAVGAHTKRVKAILDELHDGSNVRYLAFIVSGNTKLKFHPFYCASPGLGDIISKLTFYQKTPESMAKMIEGVYASVLSEGLNIEKFTAAEGRDFCNENRTVIRDGFYNILAEAHPERGHSRPRLYLENYEQKTVFKHGVALDGWPFPFPVKDLNHLTAREQYLLNVALHEGKCKWAILTSNKLQTRQLTFNMACTSDDGNGNGQAGSTSRPRKRARRASSPESDSERPQSLPPFFEEEEEEEE
ncbi:hypothetical protein PENSPDRAFT_670781 [Peniophora sp. CONT]|nr:hypothetical protein PENSPDRAFT_670781 [Peniophora sp. CONT]